jgi:acyl carrier protein
VASAELEEAPLVTILQVWSDVLGRADVTDETHFFDAGGDSLAALEVVGLLEDRLGIAVAPEAVFDAPTPRLLFALISGGHGV